MQCKGLALTVVPDGALPLREGGTGGPCLEVSPPAAAAAPVLPLDRPASQPIDTVSSSRAELKTVGQLPLYVPVWESLSIVAADKALHATGLKRPYGLAPRANNCRKFAMGADEVRNALAHNGHPMELLSTQCCPSNPQGTPQHWTANG